MSTVIVDTNCNATSESFGLTEFCSLIHNNSASGGICASMWKQDSDSIYVCPIGFCDFSIPIVQPNGKFLGKVLAGQALSVDQSEEEVLRRNCGAWHPRAAGPAGVQAHPPQDPARDGRRL